MLRPLGRSGFRWLLTGSLASWLGDQFYLVAMPWLALELTGSGLALGTILMAAAIPRALFMLFGGALSDRYSPRRVMMASSALSALFTGVFFVASLFGAVQLWHLYVLAVGLGFVDAVFWPASSAILPRLVPASELSASNSVLYTLGNGIVFVGPLAAGILVAASGTTWAFAASAICSILSVLALWPIRTPGPEAGSQTPAPLARIGRDIAEGIKVLWQDRPMRQMVTLGAVWNFMISGPMLVGAALLAAQRFGGHADAYGTLLSAYGLGGLVGGFAAGWSGSVRRKGTLILVVVAVSGVAIIGFGLSPCLWVAFAFVLVMACCENFVGVIMESWIQARVAPELTGRVISVAVFALVGLDPLSNALAGLFSRVGVGVMLFGAGVGSVFAGGLGLLSRSLRRLA